MSSPNPRVELWLFFSVSGSAPDSTQEGLSLTGLAVVEDQVRHGVLLVANRHSRSSAIEGEIGQEAGASGLDEQADVHHAGVGRHVEDDVLQARRLGRRPVDAGGSSGRRDRRGIDDEVADLTVEDVRGAPVQVTGIVVVSVDESEAGEVGSGLQRRRVAGVTDELGVVGGKDRARDGVGASWEVHHGRGGCG